ncbi:MAG: hypothetical protein LBC73_06120 [Oscillospiraceae bacterium]|jgi:lipopolysaccharide biosynthesis glycosyltransferase|nr:hypothetical protein [Oscillospiraceae bacterium]
MNVLYACDDSYAGYTGVSITSLFENNKDLDEIHVYITGYNISDENKEKFEKTAQKYNRNIVVMDVAPIDDFIRSIHFNKYRNNTITLYRIFIDELIPKSVDRILYIDSDTLVVGKLHELEDYVFDDDKACAIVLEPVYASYLNLIGLNHDSPYYSVGVIFFNVENWIKLNCKDRLLQA